MTIGEEIYLKFPVILRDKLKNQEIEFPDDTCFEYAPIKAYRCVDRKDGDFTAVSRDDFKSYAELGKKGLRGVDDNIAAKPQYYGVSLFVEPELVANARSLPSPKRKIAEGFVFQEGGPQQHNRITGHICWWLFEEVCFDGFKLMEKKEE